MAKKKSFEDSLDKMEEIVSELEAGDLPLESAIKKFEEGVQLSRFCSEKLDEAEKKVTLLLKGESGKVIEQDFAKE